MKYKIVVDKQSRTNPSDERREYEIDIEELRAKGDVCDTLVITKDEDYVMRRLELTKYFVLKELEEPIKQVIPKINIQLFEGDNYIYIADMEGNKFYAEYLIKNEFNDVYATKSEMRSNINQTAREIELSVNEKLTEYSTTEEMQSIIQALSNQIMLEVSKKVDGEDFTSAQILLLINSDNTSEARIKADKININGAISANGGFKIDEQGNVEAVNGKFTGGNITLQGGTRSNPTFIIGNKSNERVLAIPNAIFIDSNMGGLYINGTNSPNEQKAYLYIDSDYEPCLYLSKPYSTTTTKASGITTPILNQTSLESIKKNISRFNKVALDIIKKADIYEYSLKTDKDTEQKHIGFVIGKDYNTPKEVLSKKGDAIELYSAIGILWKGIQEINERLDNIEQNLKKE